MIRRLRPFFAVGRWTPRQTTAFGAYLGSVGYIAVGPLAVVFNLPERFQVADPSLFDLNAHLRELERQRDAWIRSNP